MTTAIEPGTAATISDQTQREAEATLAALRQLIREEIRSYGIGEAMIVDAVVGNTIKVRQVGSATAGAQVIPIAGIVPPVGAQVFLVKSFGGQTIAMPTSGVTLGTDSGQIPTAENVQRPLGIRDDGATEVTNPTFVDVLSPLVVAPSGTGAALGISVGSAAATVAAGDDPRLSDARIPTAHTHDDRYYTESEVDTRIAAARAGAVRGAAVARNTTSSVTTTTLTDLISDSVLTESGRTYDIKMEAGYQVTPSASNADMVLVINGVASGMVSGVGSGIKAFVFNTHFQSGVVPGTSFSWAVRFRSSGGASVSIGPGALIVTAIPRA